MDRSVFYVISLSLDDGVVYTAQTDDLDYVKNVLYVVPLLYPDAYLSVEYCFDRS